MGPFSKINGPRRPQPARESGDHVPLLPLQHGSQNLNIWNDDEDEVVATIENALLKHRESNDSFQEFLEDDEEENVIPTNKHYAENDSQVDFGRTKKSGTRSKHRRSVPPLLLTR